MSAFSLLSAPPAEAAVDISTDAVTLAVMGTRGGSPTVQGYAVQPLPPGAVVPSLTSRNLADRTAVAAALRDGISRLGLRPRRVALLVPDLAVRVSLVRFDRIPAGREDLDQLIRWQVRKAAPFPIDDAQMTYTPGVRSGEGGEFVVVVARQDVIREYESLCEEAGMHPGLVDLATFGVVDLCLGGGRPPAGDWLLVHMRSDCTSLVILREGDVIFFRTQREDEDESLTDAVHQAAMYYQDRLAGHGFTRVLACGAGRGPAAVAAARRRLEQRLGLTVEPVDPAQALTFADRGPHPSDLLGVLAPVFGIQLRPRTETVGA